MKKIGFLSVFLIVTLSLPLALSLVDKMNDSVVFCEFFDENQNEENESEEKEIYDEVEAFVQNNSHAFFHIGEFDFEHTIKNVVYTNIHSDVATPPPNFI